MLAAMSGLPPHWQRGVEAAAVAVRTANSGIFSTGFQAAATAMAPGLRRESVIGNDGGVAAGE